MIWGCPGRPGRLNEGCFRDRSFENIWGGGFEQYKEGRVVCEDGRCVRYGHTASGKLWKTGSVNLFIKKYFYPFP